MSHGIEQPLQIPKTRDKQIDRSKFDISTIDMPPKQKQIWLELLEEFDDVIAESD